MAISFRQIKNALRLLIVVGSAWGILPVWAAESAKTKAEIKTINTETKQLVGCKVGKCLVSQAPVVPSAAAQQRYEAGLLQAAKSYLEGTSVMTTPLLGLQSAYEPYDLLYQVSSMNQDLLLLQRNDYLQLAMESLGGTADKRPLVILSGGLEAQALYTGAYDRDSTGDINLSAAELDVWFIASRWAQGFLSIDYNSAPPITGSRVTNSQLYLARGFITIGNLNITPFYFTAGQMYVPFGRYYSAMLTTPIVKSLARTEERAVELGFFRRGLYMATYIYNGDTQDMEGETLFEGGVNIGYQKAGVLHLSNIDLGVGVISNLADSQGMQSNGLSDNIDQFAGFGGGAVPVDQEIIPETEDLVHRVPAADVHLQMGKGHFVVIGEYVSPLRAFSPTNMTYAESTRGAVPQAVHTELDYNCELWTKPFTFGVVYDQSWQALALSLPAQTYAIVASTSIWKDTMEGVEFRHDVNYPVMPIDSATGQLMPVTDANVGGTANTVTVQLGAYF
ncbi:MAG: hypothetical protein A3J38_06350 [Gammaproteobacteria bacterium RIFCSPHIGHO2_12_FULL_45_9]|nr:MAG: hypothetical protein A3J38_06350 [Gammaproteobacteria bacterium RIFCSPHIGHO2_12_FULL_45_9]